MPRPSGAPDQDRTTLRGTTVPAELEVQCQRCQRVRTAKRTQARHGRPRRASSASRDSHSSALGGVPADRGQQIDERDPTQRRCATWRWFYRDATASTSGNLDTPWRARARSRLTCSCVRAQVADHFMPVGRHNHRLELLRQQQPRQQLARLSAGLYVDPGCLPPYVPGRTRWPASYAARTERGDSTKPLHHVTAFPTEP
jgi:hypothetical protein